MQDTKAAADMLKDRLDFDSLIPKEYIHRRLGNLEGQVGTICSNATDISALDSAQHTINNFVTRIMQDHRGFKASEERQLNTCFIKN